MKRIISCGEPLSPGLRQYLESAFETTVINFYGASELLALGVEQQANGGMVLFDDLNIVEVIDGEHQPSVDTAALYRMLHDCVEVVEQ